MTASCREAPVRGTDPGEDHEARSLHREAGGLGRGGSGETPAYLRLQTTRKMATTWQA